MKPFHGWLPYNIVSFHVNCEWLKKIFFLLFSDLFYDIKFLLVHLYVSGSLLPLLAACFSI